MAVQLVSCGVLLPGLVSRNYRVQSQARRWLKFDPIQDYRDFMTYH